MLLILLPLENQDDQNAKDMDDVQSHGNNQVFTTLKFNGEEVHHYKQISKEISE
jgi:hypothetical protein